MATRASTKRTVRDRRRNLIRFFGLSSQDITTKEQALQAIEHASRTIFAYATVAMIVVFFLAIPSFIRPDGTLASDNFARFFSLNRPFTDCLVFVGLAIFLDRYKNMLIALGLAGFAGFKTYTYSQLHTLSDFLLLFVSVFVFLHALHLIGVIPLLRKKV